MSEYDSETDCEEIQIERRGAKKKKVEWILEKKGASINSHFF